jgi:hypothetical protein
VSPVCPTQPLVSVSNVVLDQVAFTGSAGAALLPGVLLLDAGNPGVGFVFKDVSVAGPFKVSGQYVCAGVQGTVTASQPAPGCLSPA